MLLSNVIWFMLESEKVFKFLKGASNIADKTNSGSLGRFWPSGSFLKVFAKGVEVSVVEMLWIIWNMVCKVLKPW